MTTIDSLTSIKTLAMMVCRQLKEDGIDSVLTGGAVVSIYTNNQYESYDLDFITHSTISKIKNSLSKLGFERGKGRHFIHPNTDFFVEFPSPPLTVGNRPLKRFNEIRSSVGYLKLLTPTHCVMDRLAAFYQWNDRQCLDQAVLVTKSNKIDFNEIEQWSREEGMTTKFEIFQKECSS